MTGLHRIGSITQVLCASDTSGSSPSLPQSRDPSGWGYLPSLRPRSIQVYMGGTRYRIRLKGIHYPNGFI
ncbi:MAG: hypothetical protein WAM53_03005, partial [Terrimicrobiaceae bacterium]